MEDTPPKRSRRSSILKSSRAPLSNLEDNEFEEDRTTYTRTATLKRRVSFSSTNKVQEFCNETDIIWGEKYEKPMMPVECTQKGPAVGASSVESSVCFQNLFTGEIKSSVSTNSREIHFVCSESLTTTDSSRGLQLAPRPLADCQDEEEMDLTAPNVAAFSQGSQSSLAPSQVTVINCQATTPVDKENLKATLDMNKTSLCAANMSMASQVDPGDSLAEDASYLNSPKGFNTTRFSENALDETDDSSDVMDILKGGGANKSFRPFNKTVNDTLCMDMTTFGAAAPNPAHIAEEDNTVDLVQTMNTQCDVTRNTVADLDEDSTLDMLKEQLIADSQSSVDTEDIVPKESVSSLSKHRKSISFNQTGSTYGMNCSAKMDMTMAPMEMTLAPMEMSMAPMEMSMAPMEMTLAPAEISLAVPGTCSDLDESEALAQPDTPSMDITKPMSANFDKTTRTCFEMSLEEENNHHEPIKPAEKSCRKSLNMTNYLTADLSVDHELENMKHSNAVPIGETTKSLLGSKYFNDTFCFNVDKSPSPLRSSCEMDLTRAAPENSISEDISPSKKLLANTRTILHSSNMEISSKEEPASSLKTFVTQSKPSTMDSTDYEVPDETLSDSVFASGVIEVQNTEVDSNRRHQSIKSITQRFVDQLEDQSFSMEDQKIVETSKLPRSNEIQFSQTEDIGEVCIDESGHVSVNVKRVETTGMMVSPEHNLSKQVDLSKGQELMLSPKAKQLVAIIDRSPDKPPNITLSRSMVTSPICRNFNAPNILITSATSTEEETDPSPPNAVSKLEQKERRVPVEHSPVKKHCPDTTVPACSEKSSGSSAKKKEFDISRRNISISKGNFEAEFRRCEDFEMSRIMDAAGLSKTIDEARPCRMDATRMEFSRLDSSRMDMSRMDMSKRSEMDTPRKNKTFDYSEMSISFLPPETDNGPQFAKVLDEFDAILPKKKCTELDVISRRMDEIILWFKHRQESQKVDEVKDKVDTPVEVEMEVEQTEPEVPLTPIAAKLEKMSRKQRRCWKLEKDDKSRMEFQILNNTSKLIVELDENGYFDDIKFVITNGPVATLEEFCFRIFMKKVNVARLKEVFKRKRDIPQMLEELNPRLVSFTNLVVSLQNASSKYILSLNGTKVAFQCYSRELLLVFEVHIDLANWDKLKEEDVEVKAIVGKLRSAEVKELISYERKNEHFLLKYIKSIEELIGTKEKFA